MQLDYTLLYWPAVLQVTATLQPFPFFKGLVNQMILSVSMSIVNPNFTQYLLLTCPKSLNLDFYNLSRL